MIIIIKVTEELLSSQGKIGEISKTFADFLATAENLETFVPGLFLTDRSQTAGGGDPHTLSLCFGSPQVSISSLSKFLAITVIMNLCDSGGNQPGQVLSQPLLHLLGRLRGSLGHCARVHQWGARGIHRAQPSSDGSLAGEELRHRAGRLLSATTTSSP